MGKTSDTNPNGVTRRLAFIAIWLIVRQAKSNARGAPQRNVSSEKATWLNRKRQLQPRFTCQVRWTWHSPAASALIGLISDLEM